jgi:hypothetical protein
MDSGDKFVSMMMEQKNVIVRYGRPTEGHKFRTIEASYCPDTAEHVGYYFPKTDQEFYFGSERLCRTKKGFWFLEVISDWGGAPGGYRLDGGGFAAGYCIVPLTKDQAIEWAELRGELADLAEVLGLPTDEDAVA